MNYTIEQFAEELKEMAENKKEVEIIGKWAWSTYYDNMHDIDENFKQILKRLVFLQEGYQFAISHKMLIKIADDILAGKTVDINSEEYKESD